MPVTNVTGVDFAAVRVAFSLGLLLNGKPESARINVGHICDRD
jgi:hypothetical protein